ncbi:MAG: BrnT family toxin [Spirochaetota bacterium]|nr:BrnT family toxin [Spirochaetota bacterium]
MKLEWDYRKAKSNLRKHKVSFEEAATALSDPLAATGSDPDHSIDEFRYLTFGVSGSGRLLVVAHTERGESITDFVMSIKSVCSWLFCAS